MAIFGCVLSFFSFQQLNMSSSFSPQASAAFGSRRKAAGGFDPAASVAFAKGPQSRGGFGQAAANAFGKVQQATGGFDAMAATAFGKPQQSGFDNSAFGKTQNHSGFDQNAAAAFGKKPSRREQQEAEDASRPRISIPKRTNDLSSIMDHYLGASEAPARDYTKSALHARRAEAVKAVLPPVSEAEAWPELGAPSATAVGTKKMGMSFADMMKKRVAADEVEAAIKAREDALAAAERHQAAMDSRGIFIPRPPIQRAKPRREEYADDELESDLDYVKGDDTAGVLPYETGDYDDGPGEEDEQRADEDDDYWRR